MKQYILNRDNPLSPSMVEVPNEKIPVYSSLSCAEADLANLDVGQIVATKQIIKSDVFDVVFPIGVTYTQYPQQKSPNELYGSISTWEEIDYNGAFFRASGGNANGFATSIDTLSSCKQEQATAVNGLTASFSGCACCGATGYQAYGDRSMPFYNSGSRYGAHPYGVETRSDQFAFCMVPSGSVSFTSACNETRPDNYTIKVWRRVS